MPAPPSEISTPAAPRPRRWLRRLAWVLAVLILLLAGLGTAGWMGRVTLLNRMLASGNSVWRVQVESLDWQGGHIRLTGLKVLHADQKEPVVEFQSATTNASLTDLKAAQLGDLVVENPAVHWRKGLRSDPPVPFTGLIPLVSWRSLKIMDGRMNLASGAHWRLKSEASGQSGPGVFWSDGRLDIGPSSLSLDHPEFAMELTGVPSVPAFEVKAEHLAIGGSLAADGGLLSLHDAAFTKTQLQVIPPLQSDGSADSIPSTSPPPAGAESGAALAENPNAKSVPSSATAVPAEDSGGGGSNDPVRAVAISNLTAPALLLQAPAPWKIHATTDLSSRQFLWRSGEPSTAEGIQLAQSSLTLGGFLRIPLFRLEGNLTTRGPQVSLLKMANAEIQDLNELLKTLGIPPDARPSGSARVDAEFHDIEFPADGPPRSAAVQRLALREAALTIPSQGAVTFSRAAVEAVPDEITASRRLRRVSVENPLFTMAAPAGPASRPDPYLPQPQTSGNAVPGRPAWEGWTADDLTVTGGQFALNLPPPSEVTFATGFSLRTTSDADSSDSSDKSDSSDPPNPTRWHLTLTDPALTLPARPEGPMASASELTLTADPAALWSRRELESLELKGSTVAIGEALFQWLKSMPSSPDTPTSSPTATAGNPDKPPQSSATGSLSVAAAKPAQPWLLKRLAVDRSRVLLEDIGDGRRLEIPISHQEFHELPLDAEALAKVDRLYKIEVPSITLYAPFGDGRKVATLDTNYIQFTPAGLLASRLERVDLMLPSLYAGQPLFDFIDAARKRFTELAAVPASQTLPLLVTTEPAESGNVLSAIASVQPTPSRPSNWHIPFYTESGKVLIAPKGFPWPNLPVIPFRNARGPDGKALPFLLQGETFHGELAVEPGWYEFPEYKLRLRISDRGRIVFNAPQRDRDNNLVEVFERNTIIFRQLRIDEVWLAVTYDDKGIYAKFGGQTCGGSITGGFNLYLDELYTWDGWASLSSIQMKPLTQKLSPASFRMIGPLDELTVKACGDAGSLYQATLDLKVTKPGRLEILALDQLQASIKALGGLSADLGKIGVGTLRDFDYTGCTGSLRLFGTEGDGQLALSGPAGSRNFRLNLRDYRAKVPSATLPF